MQPQVTVTGADQVRKHLRQLKGDLNDLKAVNREAAEVVEDKARILAPRRSGELVASGRSSGQARRGVVRFGSSLVKHAGPIHFGWPGHGIEPQPFLYDALDQRRAEVFDLYEDRIRKLIKENSLD